MNINPVKNLNFKSEIHVLCPYDYEKVTDTMYKRGEEYKNIFQWNIVISNPDKYEKFKGYRTDSSLVSTEDIRSCVGLLALDKGKPAPLVAHILDSEDNLNNLSKLKPFVKGTNAFVIGSKKQYELSPVLFKAVEKMVKEENLPMTIMRNLSHAWQASVAYDANLDRIFLCVSEIMNPKNFVRNMQDLKNVFSKVKISPTDTIKFFCK